jgi:hypothetical protein
MTQIFTDFKIYFPGYDALRRNQHSNRDQIIFGNGIVREAVLHKIGK